MQTGRFKGNAVELTLALASLGCALAGQWVLFNTRSGWTGGLPWFLAAVLSFGVLIARREQPAWWRPVAAWAAAHRQATLALVGLALAVASALALAAHDRAGDIFYVDIVALWAAGMAVYALAFPWPARAAWRERIRQHRREIALVAGLTLIAAALRLVWLDRLPDVMNGDEGLHSLFARGVVEGQNRYPFSTFYGAGSLHLFIASLGLRLLGYTPLASRLTPALGGILGVGATYLLARRLFGPRTAFVAAGLVTALHSHIHFSRVIGVGYIHATLFASLGMYALYSALETRNPWRAALGGLTLGLWLYIYVDARFVPAVILAWLALLLALPSQRAFVRQNVRQLAAGLGGYLAAAAPALAWGLLHPDQFNARFAADGTLWNQYYAHLADPSPAGLFRAAAEQVSHAFLTLTRYPVIDFYQSPAPLLDMLTGALFWLALVYSLLHLLDRRHLLLNIWLWAGVLSVALLTVPRSSDGYRLLIVFIPMVILIGAAAEQLARGLIAGLGGGPRALWAALAGLLAVILAVNAHIYFIQFAPACRYSDRASRIAYYAGVALSGLQQGDEVVMLGNEYLRYGTHASAQYLNPGALIQVVQEAFQPEAVALAHPSMFLVIPERAAELQAVQAAFPGGQTQEVMDCGVSALLVYRLP